MNAPNKLKEKTIIESNRVQILKDFDFEATIQFLSTIQWAEY